MERKQNKIPDVIVNMLSIRRFMFHYKWLITHQNDILMITLHLLSLTALVILFKLSLLFAEIFNLPNNKR